MNRPFYIVCSFFLLFLQALTGLSLAAPSGPTVEDIYPGLASQSLKFARPAKLPKGTLLTAGKLTIQEAEINRAISKSEPEMKKQLNKNAFFVLENLAISKLLLQEAYQAGNKTGKDEGEIIKRFLGEKVKAEPVTDQELKTFYNENRDMVGGAPLDEAKDKLKKKYQGKLNVLFVHVQEEKILTTRYGIRYIPVQVIFDKTGIEVYRHSGFFPEAEIEKKLAQLKLL